MPLNSEQTQFVTEFGHLVRGGDLNSPGELSISIPDWDWLLDNGVSITKKGPPIFRPIFNSRHQALQVINYVGVIALPSGKSIEVMPKNTDTQSLNRSRTTIFKMLQTVFDLKFVNFNDADIRKFKMPLSEVLIGKFLSLAQHLINRGLRSKYVREQGVRPFLKGKLLVSKHIQFPVYRKNHFPLEYDEYLLDRAENRLLHWAVHKVYQCSKFQSHRSHARKLLTLMDKIPQSTDPIGDYRLWQDDRLMQHYAPLKPWIDLIITNYSPWTQLGSIQGLSMLFPMETLFERYVFRMLRKRFSPYYSLSPQSYPACLVQHRGEGKFKLNPDILVKREDKVISVMDTKWKLLDQSDKNYGISQSDMYQLYAYNKCMPDGGELMLIYPKSQNFQYPLEPFDFDHKYRLWVVPYDLDKDLLVSGPWVNNFNLLDELKYAESA